MDFNANEILEMAGQIELNGVRFYRRAAELVKDPRCRKLVLDLSAMEEQHKKDFAAMQLALGGKEKAATVFDPDDEAAMYLRAFADGCVFDLDADPAADLTGAETADEVLATAIGLERDSIAFYVGLKDMVPARMGRSKVEEIIRQEMGHIVALAEMRRSLAGEA